MSSVMRTLLAMIAVSLIACSGDDGSAGMTMTAQEYFTKLETISNTSDDELGAVVQELDAMSAAASREEASEILQGAMQDLLAIWRTTQTDLEALSPPDEVADEHAALMESVQQGTDIFQRLVDDYDELGIARTIAELQGAESQEIGRRFEDHCLALQEIADAEDIAVDLNCGE